MCSTLLKHGADVTVVDDSGLTPVDVAKSKRVKATLKQAWAKATEKKGGSGQSLNPVRPPSRSANGSYNAHTFAFVAERKVMDNMHKTTTVHVCPLVVITK